MNYKEELNKLRKHRKRYRPVMAMLVNLHTSSNASDFPMELIDEKEILIMLELLDIGYLDENVLIVRRRFDDIVSLAYTGEYPFTDGGEIFFHHGGGTLKRKMSKIFRKLINNANIRPR